MNNGSCDGCLIKGKFCSIFKAGKEENCPCRICLIKVMCKYSCEEYQTFVRKIQPIVDKVKN